MLEREEHCYLSFLLSFLFIRYLLFFNVSFPGFNSMIFSSLININSGYLSTCYHKLKTGALSYRLLSCKLLVLLIDRLINPSRRHLKATAARQMKLPLYSVKRVVSSSSSQHSSTSHARSRHEFQCASILQRSRR